MPYFHHDGRRLHYLDRGDGNPIVLLHGLLWSSRMFVRLRRALPGQRVIFLDLRGHGLSDRPTDREVYTWEGFASDVIALLDHLELERAVVGGLSLGANVTLRTGIDHPERCAGLVVEMPVLSRAEDVANTLFGGLASVIDTGAPILRGIGRVARRLPVPRMIPELAAIRDVATVDPDSAAAIIRGLLDSGLLPEDPVTLARLQMPVLVIGHRNDPLHVFADATDLADRLPDGRFVSASSIFEYRMRPERLARHLRGFLADVWEPSDAV